MSQPGAATLTLSFPEVRERGDRLAVARGGDRYDRARQVGRRIRGAQVVVRPEVARGGDDEDVVGSRVGDRLLEGRVAREERPAQVDYSGTVSDRVVNGARRRAQVDEVPVPGLESHDLRFWVEPRDDPRHVGAVTGVVVEVACLGEEVRARDVVDDTVPVVVDAVSRDLRRIRPEVARKRWMPQIDSSVDHRDDHDRRCAALRAAGFRGRLRLDPGLRLRFVEETSPRAPQASPLRRIDVPERRRDEERSRNRRRAPGRRARLCGTSNGARRARKCERNSSGAGRLPAACVSRQIAAADVSP